MALRPPRFIRRVLASFRWRARDRDMQREMAFHVDSLARDYARGGLSDADAQCAARRQFGNLTRLKERGHDERTMRVAEDVLRDIRHAARGLWRSPGFSLAVILTLALGIGGNTAVFSVVDQLLLRPLPYPDGDQLAIVEESTGGLNSRADVSPANWLDWQRESRTFQRFAAWQPWAFTLTGAGEPRRVNAQQVSSEFFPLLGVAPLLGRTISNEDDRPSGPPVAVLSYRAWQEQLGGDRNAIGRTVQLDERPYEIVGVMPAGFRFVREDVDLWTAYQLDRNRPWRETTDGRFMEVVGRLAAGATIGTARSEMGGIARRLAATYAFNRNTSVTVTPLREVLTGQVRTLVLVLFAGVGVLLAIACFNVANMLLARSASRQREIAIRASLGAGRWAIARSVLFESLLLAGAGGALGLGLARWSLDALLAVAPTNLLGVSELFIDRRVLIYAFGVSLATGANRRPRIDDRVRAAIDCRRIADARIDGRSRTPCATGARRRASRHDRRPALRRRCPRSHAHRAGSRTHGIRRPRRAHDESGDLAGAISRRAPPRLLSRGADAPSRVAGHRIRGRRSKPADDRQSSRRNEVS